MMAWSGAPEAADAALAPFRALATPIVDLVRPSPYSSMYALDPPAEVRPMVAIRSRFLNRFDRDVAHNFIEALEMCDAPMKLGQIRVLGGAFSRVPADATAFAHRDGRILVAMMAMYGGGRDVVAAQEKWASDALAGLRTATGAAYVNFLSNEGATGLEAAYPRATWERLRQVKRMYDPENLFRMNQNIPPAT
jgi:FAD/FMN-containing dehydrogenase